MVVAVGSLACDDVDAAGDAELDPGKGPVLSRTPKFVPATLTQRIVKVCAHNTEPLVFGVADVRAGLTELVLDGDNVGPLYAGSVLGTLDDDALTLAQPGAMRKGGHVLQLVSPGANGPLWSRKLNLSIRGCPVPQLRGEHSANAVAAGRRLVAFGPPEQNVLAVLSVDPLAPTLTLFRGRGRGWAFDRPLVVDVPGLVVEPNELVPAFAVSLHVGHDADPSAAPALPAEPDRIRIAWRVGVGGEGVDVREVVDDRAGSVEIGDATRAVSAVDVARPTAAFTGLGWPAFAGDVLLIEARDHVDIEKPFPGDRRVIAARWRLGASRVEPGVVLDTEVLADLDYLGTALDTRAGELGHPVPVALRVGGRVGLLRRDPLTGHVYALALHQAAPGFTGDLVNLTTIVGGILSRTTGGLWNDGEVRVRLVDAGGRNEPRMRVVDPALRPTTPPTGPMVATVSRGAAVFLVPYGDGTAVHAYPITGDQVEPTRLAGLRCDAIAIRGLALGDDPDATGLVCLRDGLVYPGLLHAADPPEDDD